MKGEHLKENKYKTNGLKYVRITLISCEEHISERN